MARERKPLGPVGHANDRDGAVLERQHKQIVLRAAPVQPQSSPGASGRRRGRGRASCASHLVELDVVDPRASLQREDLGRGLRVPPSALSQRARPVRRASSRGVGGRGAHARRFGTPRPSGPCRSRSGRRSRTTGPSRRLRGARLGKAQHARERRRPRRRATSGARPATFGQLGPEGRAAGHEVPQAQRAVRARGQRELARRMHRHRQDGVPGVRARVCARGSRAPRSARRGQYRRSPGQPHTCARGAP